MSEFNPIALRPLIKKFQHGTEALTNNEVRQLREYYRVASDVAKADPALEGISAYVNLSYQQLDRFFEARKLKEPETDSAS
ncbi:hypothetical protein YOLOSWAG_277 [Erwinia phage vB_EamM_Yoloswag]|uniref:Uncharacterized protein n=1 Tax=Erwinia phage vB_EamM_Yoloswag TaxID=1958956 RepID=A0A1S6L3L9_9CAUD|nr:hypothetical protein HOR66_gp277 [Erwinia phage vB_EamM_Yoloswag]AQT28749.1 hypothetical protein YOLOSWAG_277 [Erwinia phage vB_EamM_Yoloswag]